MKNRANATGRLGFQPPTYDITNIIMEAKESERQMQEAKRRAQIIIRRQTDFMAKAG